MKRHKLENVGRKAGMVFAYFLFTTLLFYILFFLNKLPGSWSYFHIMVITLIISLVGVVVGKFLR